MALVVIVITIVYENILQWMICKNHHPHLKQDNIIVFKKTDVGHVCRRITAVYLLVVEGVHERYEPPGLSFLVQRQLRNVSNKDGVKQSGYLQIVAGP